MKLFLLAGFVGAFGASTLSADPADLALVAAMKLPDAPNYAWLTTIDDDARSYTIDGQTDRASDLSLVTMPMVAAVRRRAGTGTANSDNVSTAAFKGDEKFVVQVDSAWKTEGELANTDSSHAGFRGRETGGAGALRGRGRRGRGGGFPSIDGEGNERSTVPAYSNLQKTLSRPHEELAIIVAGASDLRTEGEIVSGALSETAAKLLLVHPGQKEILPLKATGTFRFWLKDGNLVKYEARLEGTLAITSNGKRREVTVHQTALTELRNVGTTKVDLPDDAKKKLGV